MRYKKSRVTNWIPAYFSQENSTGLFILVVVFSMAVFAADLGIPLGFAVWLIYMLPLYLTFYIVHGNYYWIFPSVYTVFIVTAFLFHGQAEALYLAVVNRGLGIALLWLTAYLLASRKKAEIALHRSEDIVRNVNSVILTTDSRGIIDYINNYGLQIFGSEPSWFLGRNITELLIPAEKPGKPAEHLFP